MKFLFSALFLPLALAAAERPNIVLIITDDQGYGDLGHTAIRSSRRPHIDELAAEVAPT